MNKEKHKVQLKISLSTILFTNSKRHLSLFISLFLFFISLQVYAINIDSLKKITETSPYAKEIRKAYIELAENKNEIKQNEVVDIAKEFLTFAKKSNIKKDIAIAHHFLAIALRWNTNYTVAIDNLYKEEGVRLKINDSLGLGHVYMELAEAYRAIYEYKQSLQIARKSHQIFASINDKPGLAAIMNRISAIYYETSVNVSEDSSYINSKGKEKLDTALILAKKSNIIAKKNQNLQLIISNYIQIGAIESAFGNYKLALQSHFKAYNYIGSNIQTDFVSLITKNIASVNYEIGNYKSALHWAYISYGVAVDFDNQIYIWLSADMLQRVYNKLNHKDSSYKYNAISKTARLSFFDESHAKEKNLLEAKILKERYDKKIAIEQDEQKMIYSILIVSSVFILIIMLLFYLRYKQLKKYNIILSKQNALINEQKNELHEMNVQKDKLYSVIAHDLRSPLVGLIGLLEIMDTTGDAMSNDKKKEYISMIFSSAKKEYELLENLLEWARLQQGTIKLTPINISLLGNIQYSISNYSTHIQNKQITITNKILNSTTVYADENMANSVIRNLISNAIKFTSVGGNIIIDFEETEDSTIISVKDNGIGMPPLILDNLFKIGSDNSRPGTENEPSTGLGLLICNEYAMQNNGELWAESQENFGSTFYLKLPKGKE